MARIPMLDPSEFDDELAELMDAGSKTPFEVGVVRVYAHRPELAKAYVRFLRELRRPGVLSRRLVELVRLRVAFHNQCRSCMAVRYSDGVEAGVTEDLVCELAEPEEAPNLTAAERAALRFADLLATNHHAIDDEEMAALRAHFDEEEIVELGMNIAVFVGFGRLSMAWDMVDELPDRFRQRDGDAITPWGSDALIVGPAR